MKEKPLIYLACPFSHPDKNVELQRYEIANRTAAGLMRAGLYIFSPLSHSFPIDKYVQMVGKKSHRFWMDQDLIVLRRCQLLMIINIDGTEESKGVVEEIEEATKLKLPVRIIDPDFFPSPEYVEKINSRF
jgi:nucleoside 2-deoxyribosyltransferase